jgi:hypothetical protein
MSEPMPEFVDKLSIYALTCALRDLNAALDSGKAVTFAEVYAHLESGDLVEHLQKRLRVHLSEVRPAIDQNKYFIDALRFVLDKGRESRAFGVQNNGVCMLIAYVTEIIQRGLWDIASLKMYDQPG